MSRPLVTALFGCGQIGTGYAADPLMARHYRYASHAQVLNDHADFDWHVAVDPRSESAQACAAAYGVAAATDVSGIAAPETIEVAVLATPPGTRLALLNALPGLKAVIVEKPLGADIAEAQAFAAACKARGLVCQVNLPRRVDASHRALAVGGLAERIGRVQGVFLVYGNGLINNGTHMIDLARMLLGEVAHASVPAGATSFVEGPIPGDRNLPFCLAMENGVTVMGQPLSFAAYRENGLDLWGEKGRLAIVQEGLRFCFFPRRDNRSTTGAHELVNDAPETETTTMGEALHAIYDDLAEALTQGRTPASTLHSALATARVVATLMAAAPSEMAA